MSQAHRTASASELVERLRDLHEGARHLAAVVSAGDAAVPWLERLLRGPSEPVEQPRCLAADALGLIGTRRAVDALLRALSDSTERRLEPVLEQAEYVVVNCIAENLGGSRDPRVVHALIEALFVRAYPEAVHALGRLENADAVPVLVERLHADVTREAAMDALRGFGPDFVRPHLVAAVTAGPAQGETERSDRAWGRAAASTLLGEIGGGEGALRRALSDRSEDVQLAAALALCATGECDDDVLRILVNALQTVDWQRADDVQTALAAAGSHTLGPLEQAFEGAPRTPSTDRLRSRIVDTVRQIDSPQAREALGRMEDRPYASRTARHVPFTRRLLQWVRRGRSALRRRGRGRQWRSDTPAVGPAGHPTR